ncbi:F-box only protein 15-like [Acanthochromis polyacanthus]|uniref:F-box only protein 15-like n=1 Tax=Acanthochromis polyacanthus TaxID=80966 RepID=UPI002234560E|nr:F-box only protein 15-like [Acanthochromis polyacanthus]
MAAGRGEFFSNFLRGLERRPAPEKPEKPERHGGPQSGPGRGAAGLRGAAAPERGPAGGWRRTRQPVRAWSPAEESSCSKPQKHEQQPAFTKVTSSRKKENLVEKLPSEILFKILSYLDASSLFCVAHVSKLFYRLASDDVMWKNLYVSEFGSQTWKPKPADETVEGNQSGRWKKMYFRTVAGQEVKRWRKELRDISPYTGLPRHTEWVLRNLNLSWELTVTDRLGQETTLEQSRAYFFESSVIIRWSEGSFPLYYHISSIQIHGVRKENRKSAKVSRPRWRSLILKLDIKTHPYRFKGKDKLINLRYLPQGVIIGLWRGQNDVAFIMVSLHFHKLVEKSVLGSPVCPYSDCIDPLPVDDSDPEFGLHGYTLHFVLHNTGTEIMSGHFQQLSCNPAQVQRSLIKLDVINRTNLSQHRSLSGSIKLPWKSDELEGSVENCCIMTLTLLDEFQTPFWCVSSPVSIQAAKKSPSSDYSDDHFLMDYYDSEGKVKMVLVWLKEQNQFFLISLSLFVAVYKVNQRFSRNY